MLDAARLKQSIKNNMVAAGAQEGEHSWLDQFTAAIADAVVAETKQAQVMVIVAGGSSEGTHTGTVQ